MASLFHVWVVVDQTLPTQLQRSLKLKDLALILLWQVFRGVARCCLPRFQGQSQHLKYQNRILKKVSLAHKACLHHLSKKVS